MTGPTASIRPPIDTAGVMSGLSDIILYQPLTSCLSSR